MRDICMSLVCTFYREFTEKDVKYVILAIIAAIAVGLIQFFLDTVLFGAVFAFKAVKGILTLVAKIALYVIAFLVLFKLFRALVKAAAIGFAIGFFPCLFIYCINKIRKSS